MKRWTIIVILAGLCLLTSMLLFNTNAELRTVKAQFYSAEIELESTKVELGATESELQLTKLELDATETELSHALDEMSITRAELEVTRDELVELETELTDLLISYEGLMTGYGYTIKDPTYNKMMRFLRNDDTDKNRYIEDKYDCKNYSTDLCNSAEAVGIRCAYVSIGYPGGIGHVIVAFNTIEKGLIYIEPQSDELVNVEIGKHFYECVVPKPGYYYEEPDHDDTIKEILIAW